MARKKGTKKMPSSCNRSKFEAKASKRKAPEYNGFFLNVKVRLHLRLDMMARKDTSDFDKGEVC
jgi:hypothetical protein